MDAPSADLVEEVGRSGKKTETLTASTRFRLKATRRDEIASSDWARVNVAAKDKPISIGIAQNSCAGNAALFQHPDPGLTADIQAAAEESWAGLTIQSIQVAGTQSAHVEHAGQSIDVTNTSTEVLKGHPLNGPWKVIVTGACHDAPGQITLLVTLAQCQ